MSVHLPNVCAVVYRCFDASGALLYIGRTSRVPQRWAEHREAQSWWPEVDRIDVTWFTEAKEAYQEERRAILAEDPRYNKSRVPVVRQHRRAPLTWVPLPDELESRIAAAARKRARSKSRSPEKDDGLGAVVYEALDLGCRPGAVAHPAGLNYDQLKGFVAKYLTRHPELEPIPQRPAHGIAAMRARKVA